LSLEDIQVQARALADNLANDIELCKDREEHVRISARANEAEALAQLAYDVFIQSLA
jgi:hypothetical protein